MLCLKMKLFSVLFLCFVVYCSSYKILAIFPYNGRSHHIYYSALIEELAKRQHDVTVINYHAMQSLPTLRQISLQKEENTIDQVNIEEHLKVLSISDIYLAYDSAQVFKHIANTNCKKLMNSKEIQDLTKSAVHYDLVIVEQFVTDCGLAIAYKLNTPTMGMTAHILMPWTYSRLGAPNNPAYVPNHFFSSGTKPDLFNKVKSLIINFGMNIYYTYVIQKSDQDIVHKVYPEVPPLEELGKNMSLILINQYFPLTGPRLYSSNVVEIGGMHIDHNAQIEDKGLQDFLNSANNGVVYISFGSVASNIPRKLSNEIIKWVQKSNMRFVWKTDISDWVPPSNVVLGKWMPQVAVLSNCDSYKILAVFPHSARSHHIYFTPLVEELARRQHDVTVINYHPMQIQPRLRQISLQDKNNASASVDIVRRMEVLSISDIYLAYATAQVFKNIANNNCKKLVNNHEVQEMIKSAAHYDLVIVEQFVTDCGLAIAYKLNAPTMGVAAHTLSPWTYSRLGAPNDPAYVPNHFFGSGTKPNLYNRVKSAIINFGMNMYYTHVIQKSDQDIIHEVYPDVPLLEELGKNMSLIMINQYFPLTGPRLYSSNVVEVGGIHINHNAQIEDKGLQDFLNTANNGVVYISFGSVASNIPRKLSNEIINLVQKSNLRFVWKTDISDWVPPRNVFLGKWMPQAAILCHPNVVAFVSHCGMLSSSEAIHCGVPIIGVPLFGDQFSNAQSAVESGLGVIVDVLTLNERVLADALKTVLSKTYQRKAKELSKIWKDRPLSPMDTAIFWIEYVARNKGAVNMRPPTVKLPLYQYLMIDVFLIIGAILLLMTYIVVRISVTKQVQANESVIKRKND